VAFLCYTLNFTYQDVMNMRIEKIERYFEIAKKFKEEDLKQVSL
jgi:hypothetical protein